jgi:hypothetical protein
MSERSNFLNGARTARQRCLAGNAGQLPLAMFKRISLSVIDYRFVIVDIVRYIVMSNVFSDSVSMRDVYPCMDVAKIRAMVKRILKMDFDGKSLADYGIDTVTLQRQITLALCRPAAK